MLVDPHAFSRQPTQPRRPTMRESPATTTPTPVALQRRKPADRPPNRAELPQQGRSKAATKASKNATVRRPGIPYESAGDSVGRISLKFCRQNFVGRILPTQSRSRVFQGATFDATLGGGSGSAHPLTLHCAGDGMVITTAELVTMPTGTAAPATTAQLGGQLGGAQPQSTGVEGGLERLRTAPAIDVLNLFAALGQAGLAEQLGKVAAPVSRRCRAQPVGHGAAH